MNILNILEVQGQASAQAVNPTVPSTWNGRVFVVVAGGLGNDLACYWQNASEGWAIEQIMSGGHKVSARKLADSDLEALVLTGVMQGVPEGYYWRA